MEPKKREDLQKIINVLSTKFSHEHFENIALILQRDAYISELNPVINEICYCLLFRINIASITATNHFLESLLKRAIVSTETGNNPLKSLDEIETKYKPVMDEVMKLRLVDTINRSHKNGLINDEQKTKLLAYKDTLRNGFSHAEPKKIFGDTTTRVAMGSFLNPNLKLTPKEIPIKDMYLMHGLAIELFAEKNAYPYFVFVYNLMLGIEEKLKHGNT